MIWKLKCVYNQNICDIYVKIVGLSYERSVKLQKIISIKNENNLDEGY